MRARNGPLWLGQAAFFITQKIRQKEKAELDCLRPPLPFHRSGDRRLLSTLLLPGPFFN